MASSQARFADKRYPNWIKSSLSLLYLKQGIEGIIDTEAADFHRRLKQASAVINAGPQACSSCTYRSMTKDTHRQMWHMKCPLCNAWLQEIMQHHAHQPLSNLSRENTDPQLWPTTPYEVMKFYMPYGCERDQSAKDGDVQSLLRLVQNCRHFSRCGKIGRLDLVDELLDIRNSLFHSGNFLVEDGDLKNYLDTMLKFLGGLPPSEMAAVKARDEIKKLRDGILDLSLNKEAELIAIQQSQIALDRDLKTLQDSDMKTRKELQEVKDKFNKFLEDNDLANDLARMSKSIQQQEKRTTDLENLTQAHDSTLQAHSSKMQAHDSTLQAHSSKMQAHDSTLEACSSKLQVHDRVIRGQKRKQHALSTEIRAEKRKRHAYARTQQAHSSRLQATEDRLGQIEIDSQQRNQEVQPEEITEEDISSLQAALIDHYRDHSLVVPNPVVPQKLGLEEIYVCPQIKVLRESKNPRAGLKNVQNRANPTNTSMCKQIFCTEDYKSKQIYITSDAGMGKTLFCRYLVHLWCNVCSSTPSDSGSDFGPGDDSNNQERKALTEDNRRIMSSFKLLFYISLRESVKQYNITEMIDSQILKFIKHKKMLKASDILQNEGCLVIIDGLDEWVCPEDADIPHFVKSGIPGRLGLNRNTVYLTTTRPWKLDVLKLDSPEVDKHVELVGLNENSSKQLCLKLTKLLSDNELVERTSKKLWAELKEKNLMHLNNIPVVLTQLVCLWFDKQDLGQSQVQLYCSMLEMLLERPDKASQTCTASPKTEPTVTFLPECFSNHPYCQAHQQLLLSLCRFAFEALFDQKRENALVFKSSQMKIYNVGEKNIDLCLKSGILSQNKVLSKVSVIEKKISFLHKKLQEFLAALFMVNRENAEIVAFRVKTFCTSVDTMLEMSQVWMFVSGISPAMSRQVLSEVLSHVESVDRRLQQYRQTRTAPWSDTALQRSIQTCIAGCVEEARSNGHRDLRLPLHDFVIEYDTISECLENLFTSNLESVKSVHINTNYMTGQAVGRVGRIVGQLQDTRLQKLFMHDLGSVIFDVEKTLGKTLTANKHHLTCLELHNISLTGETPADVWDVVTNLSVFDLSGVRLTHKRREQLLLSVSTATAMRQLKLEWLHCTNHGGRCETVLDLSGCTQLRTLVLYNMYITKMAAVANCMEYVRMSYVTIPGRQLEPFVRELSSASRPLTVGLHGVTVTGDSGSPVDLTYLRYSENVEVTGAKGSPVDLTCLRHSDNVEVTGASESPVDLTYLRHRPHIDLTYLRYTDNVEVTHWDYDGGNFISRINFQTRQQTTSDPDNQPQTSTPSV